VAIHLDCFVASLLAMTVYFHRAIGIIIAQLAIVEEEGDETLHWFDLLVDSVRVKADQVALLKQEGGEILSMIVASIRTAKARR
jgi:hypothetical protein